MSLQPCVPVKNIVPFINQKPGEKKEIRFGVGGFRDDAHGITFYGDAGISRKLPLEMDAMNVSTPEEAGYANYQMVSMWYRVSKKSSCPELPNILVDLKSEMKQKGWEIVTDLCTKKSVVFQRTDRFPRFSISEVQQILGTSQKYAELMFGKRLPLAR